MAASAGTIEIVWSAYESVLSRGRLSYLSAPITSGRRAVEALAAGAAKGDVIRDNVARGSALAREIASKIDTPIVAPTIFDANPQGWTQADYMRMWLGMIEKNIGKMFMSPGWAWSNGCAEEYLKTINMGLGFGARSDILPLRPDKSVLYLHEGLEEISEALHVLYDMKAPVTTLCSVFLGLYTGYMTWCMPEISRDELPKDYNREVLHGANGATISRIVKRTAPLLRHAHGWDGSLSMHTSTGAMRTIMAWPEGVVFDVIEGA